METNSQDVDHMQLNLFWGLLYYWSNAKEMVDGFTYWGFRTKMTKDIPKFLDVMLCFSLRSNGAVEVAAELLESLASGFALLHSLDPPSEISIV